MSGKPLVGNTIVESGGWIAGPRTAAPLCDWGAEVRPAPQPGADTASVLRVVGCSEQSIVDLTANDSPFPCER